MHAAKSLPAGRCRAARHPADVGSLTVRFNRWIEGDADYLLRVVVSDLTAYERFLKEHLTRVAGVASIKSSFALNQVKYSTALPLAGV